MNDMNSEAIELPPRKSGGDYQRHDERAVSTFPTLSLIWPSLDSAIAPPYRATAPAARAGWFLDRIPAAMVVSTSSAAWQEKPRPVGNPTKACRPPCLCEATGLRDLHPSFVGSGWKPPSRPWPQPARGGLGAAWVSLKRQALENGG